MGAWAWPEKNACDSRVQPLTVFALCGLADHAHEDDHEHEMTGDAQAAGRTLAAYTAAGESPEARLVLRDTRLPEQGPLLSADFASNAS